MKNAKLFNLLKDTDLLSLVSLGDHAINCYCATGNKMYLDEYLDYKTQFQFYFDDIEFDTARRCIANTFRNKCKVIQRVQERVEYIASNVNDTYKAYFITLTFDDKKYNIDQYELSETRKDIRLMLARYCKCYVANRDYGDLHDRLHFHGVVLICKSKKDKFEKFYNKHFGFTYFELIDEKSRAIAKYVTKLTFHFVKESTHHIDREHLIYSRL